MCAFSLLSPAPNETHKPKAASPGAFTACILTNQSQRQCKALNQIDMET